MTQIHSTPLPVRIAVSKPVVKLDTLLILRIIFPLSLLDDLRQVFQKVIYYPLPPFPSPNPTYPLPTAEEYASADVLLSVAVPPGLTDFNQTPRLKLWQGLSAGYNHITDHPYFRSIPESSGAIFANASGIHVSTIGEHCLAVLLMLNHKLGQLAILGHEKEHWVRAQELFGEGFIRELKGQTVGIVGYGHIGREAARLVHSCGASVIALTRSGKRATIGGYLIPGTGDPSGALPTAWYSSEDPVSRTAFFSAADAVITTLPSSAATKKFIGVQELTEMKDNAVLVNIGRGETVDTEALVLALQDSDGKAEGPPCKRTLRIGGAGLDVTDPEPLPDHHPLWRLPNAIVTPHSSGLSKDYFVRAVDLLIINTHRLREGYGALNAFRGRGEDDV